ncbi:unnamed protein product [Closterium sp. NIES-54]
MLCCIVHCRGEPAGAGGTLHEGGGAEGRARDGDGRKGHAGHGHGADAAQLFNKSLLFYPISPCTVLCVLFCAGAMRRGAALCAAGENRLVQEALCTRAVGQRGVRVLVMDGGGMRGMAMVQMLRQIEGRTGRRVHELFDLVCGTSTGGMLAAELGIKRLTLDQCDDVYRRLGKLVFSNVEAMESASWRDKLDQLYKSSSQNYRVVVHGSKHNAEQFEQLLQEMCTDDDGDLLIDSAVKGGPKVFVVSTLVSVTPATPFVFRNYQVSSLT